jgi:hypothetical protein
MRFDRKLLIEKLVTTGHLNVPERLALGSEPPNTSEVTAVITYILNKTGSFPEDAKPWTEGHIVDERTILQSLPGGKTRLIQQRGHPIVPTRLAQQKVIDFNDVESAVKSYIKTEWGSGIDGIRIYPTNFVI